MKLADVQPALKAWVAILSGVDPAFVVFENEPRPRTNGTLALLSWVSDAAVGVDENRYEDSGAAAPDGNLLPVSVGDRLVALQVGFETTDQRPDAPNARACAVRMRDRIRLRSSLSRIADMNLGLVGTDPIVQADYRAEQRMVARAVLGLRFNATSYERDDAAGIVGQIESVDVTSQLADVDGAQLPAALQLDHVNIPNAQGGP